MRAATLLEYASLIAHFHYIGIGKFANFGEVGRVWFSSNLRCGCLENVGK